MGLGPRDPFKDLLSLQERMNQLFEESLVQFSGSKPQVEQWHPPVDVVETDSAILLMAELPGLDISQISLEVSDHCLTLRGERCSPGGAGNDIYHRVERGYGKFERIFSLPENVDHTQIKASLHDGVLEISLPKRPLEQHYTIPVDNPTS